MASKAHWNQILQELDASGMGVRRYAVEKGLSKSSLYYHLKRRREEMESVQVLTLREGAVHELNLATRQRCGLSCEIKQGSLTLSFDELPTAEWLGALMKALR